MHPVAIQRGGKLSLSDVEQQELAFPGTDYAHEGGELGALYRREGGQEAAAEQRHQVFAFLKQVDRFQQADRKIEFVGSRGTGKTSMAKILAAALNCANGTTTEPCGECSACIAIASATSSRSDAPANARNTTPADGCAWLTEGTMATPMPLATKLTMVCTCTASCTTSGMKPAAWHTDTTWLRRVCAATEDYMTKGWLDRSRSLRRLRCASALAAGRTATSWSCSTGVSAAAVASVTG